MEKDKVISKNILLRKLKIAGKILLWIFSGLLCLLIFVIILIRLPAIQNRIKNIVVTSFSKKINTPIEVNRLYVNFFGKIVIEGVLVLDQRHEPLLNAGEIKVGFNPFPLLRNHIEVTSIALENASFNYRISDSTGKSNLDFIVKAFADNTKTVKVSTASEWKLMVNSIQLKDVHFLYDNGSDSMKLQLHVGQASIDLPETDVFLKKYVVRSLSLSNSQGKITTYNMVPSKNTTGNAETQDSLVSHSKTQEMLTVLQNVKLKNVSFVMLDQVSGSGGTYKIDVASFSPDTIDIYRRVISIHQMEIDHGIVSVRNVQNTVGVEKAKPVISTGSNLGWRISLGILKLKLDTIQVSSISKPSKGMNDHNLLLSFSHIVLNADHSFYSTDVWKSNIKVQLQDNRTKQTALLSTRFSRESERLTANSIQLTTGTSFLKANVTAVIFPYVKGSIPDFHLQIHSSSIRQADIVNYMPAIPILKRYIIPKHVELSCLFSSKNNSIQADGVMNSDLGKLLFNTKINQVIPIDSCGYAITLHTTDLDVGKILKNPALGPVSTLIQVEGKGLNPYTMNSKADIGIDAVTVNRQTYHNMHINALISKGVVALNATSDMAAAKFQLVASGHLHKTASDFHLKTKIQNIDFRALGFTKDTMSFSGNISAYFNGKDSVHFSAGADTMQLHVIFPVKEINLHSVLTYSQNGDITQSMFDAEPFKLSYTGNMQFGEIPGALKRYLGKFEEIALRPKQTRDSDYFSVDLLVKNLSSINPLLPAGLFIPQKGSVKASLKNGKFSTVGDFKYIEFGKYEFESVKFHVDGQDSTLAVNLSVASVNTPFQLVRNIDISAKYNAGLFDSKVKFADELGDAWFDIAFSGDMKRSDRFFVLHNSLLLNYQQWVTPVGNKIILGDKGLTFKNVSIRHDDREILLKDNTANPEEMEVEFKKLDLAKIAAIWKGDSTSFTGFLNGKVTAFHLFNKTLQPTFNAVLGINKITIAGQKVGSLNLAASNTSNADIAHIDLKLGEDTVLLSVIGDYGLKQHEPMHFNLVAKDFNLINITPFTANVITNPRGILNASIDVSGTTSKPNVTGYLGFKDVNMFLNSVQTAFKINDQKLTFNNNKVDFSSFTIGDISGHPMIINGNIAVVDFKEVQYNLHLDLHNFLAYHVNTSNQADKLSKALMSGTISISGRNTSPVVRATVQMDEGSSLYYKMTKHGTDVSAKGVVEFNGATAPETEAPSVAIMQNLNLTANIVVADETRITIITDPARNLGLSLTAGGTLSMRQLPGQSPSLNGKVNITGGDYTLAISGLKRTFAISDSSSITWDGNLTDPAMNLKATYRVNTPSSALMPGTDEKYLTAIPFLVNMIIEGRLSQPSFHFQLALPSEYESTYGDVAALLLVINRDENQVNSKALTLLLFGSFGFNNFSNIIYNGSGGTNALISRSLNQVASSVVKKVDLHFDLQSLDIYGGTTGENLRTDMKVSVSKNFLDKRLTTQLGGTFVLQGDPQEESKPLWDKVVPEFDIGYILDKERLWKVKGFRRSEYKGLIEGKVISLGTGLVFEKNYDTLRDIFRKKSSKKKSVTQVIIDKK